MDIIARVILLLVVWLVVGTVVALFIGRVFALSNADSLDAQQFVLEPASPVSHVAVNASSGSTVAARYKCNDCTLATDCAIKMPGSEQCQLRLVAAAHF
jgi:hypothetical protein